MASGDLIVQVADKVTLDKCYELLQGLEASGGASLKDVEVFVADYMNDEVMVTRGALDVYKRIIIS